MTRFLATTALAVLAPGLSLADCGPNPVPDPFADPDDRVALICEGLDPDGFDAQLGDDNDFEIRDGAVVRGPVAITGPGETFVRDGALIEPQPDATAITLNLTGRLTIDDGANVRADTDTIVTTSQLNSLIDNDGEVLSRRGSVVLYREDNRGGGFVTTDRLVNTGTMVGETAVVDATRRNTVSITNSGNMRADAGPAIAGSGDLTVRNLPRRDGADFPADDIAGISEGILSLGELTLTNSSSVRGLGLDASGVSLNAGRIDNSGRIESTAGGSDGVRLLGFGGGEVRIVNTGSISGGTGIDFLGSTGAAQPTPPGGLPDLTTDVALDYVQREGGRLAGFEGTAFALADASDSVEILDGRVVGQGLFRGGDDTLTLGDQLGDGVAGIDLFNRSRLDLGLFDGGAGTDTAIFDGDGLGDLLSAEFGPGDTALLTFRDADAAQIELRGFELFGFDDPDAFTPLILTAEEVRDALAPVPLPSGGWLLLAGLGALAARSRRT